MTTLPPSRIKPENPTRVLEITWQDGRICPLKMRELRGSCGCAMCVDEMTGVRVVGVEDIPPEIEVRDLSLVGNYAVKIVWSDGHSTGLFTWERLHELCAAQASGGA